MNVASTQFTLATNSFEIYVAGCDGKCSDKCHNKELWDFKAGKPYEEYKQKIQRTLNDFDNLIDKVWILGGEPLLQPKKDLLDLIAFIRNNSTKPIWVWTRFDEPYIPKDIFESVDFIKTGGYEEQLLCDDNIQYGVKLASKNQKIIDTSEGRNLNG